MGNKIIDQDMELSAKYLCSWLTLLSGIDIHDLLTVPCPSICKSKRDEKNATTRAPFHIIDSTSSSVLWRRSRAMNLVCLLADVLFYYGFKVCVVAWSKQTEKLSEWHTSCDSHRFGL